MGLLEEFTTSPCSIWIPTCPKCGTTDVYAHGGITPDSPGNYGCRPCNLTHLRPVSYRRDENDHTVCCA